LSGEQIKKNGRERERNVFIDWWLEREKKNLHIQSTEKRAREREKDTHTNEGHDLIEFFLRQLRLPIHSFFPPSSSSLSMQA